MLLEMARLLESSITVDTLVRTTYNLFITIEYVKASLLRQCLNKSCPADYIP